MVMLFMTNIPRHHIQTKLNQCNITAPAITRAVKGSSRDKLCQELVVEYLQLRRWMRRLRLLYKCFSTGQTSHIHNLLPQIRNFHRHPNIFHVFPRRIEYFKNSFFPRVINRLNKFDPNIRRSINHNTFLNALLKFMRLFERKIFNINDPLGIKILTKLRLRFTNLDTFLKTH